MYACVEKVGHGFIPLSCDIRTILQRCYFDSAINVKINGTIMKKQLHGGWTMPFYSERYGHRQPKNSHIT